MQPLGVKQLLVIGVSVMTFLICNNIPVISNIFVDIIVRSSAAIIIYAGIILLLKVSPDLNERYWVYKNYIKNFFTTKNH